MESMRSTARATNEGSIGLPDSSSILSRSAPSPMTSSPSTEKCPSSGRSTTVNTADACPFVPTSQPICTELNCPVAYRLRIARWRTRKLRVSPLVIPISESTVGVVTRLLPRMITESGVAHGPEACAPTPVVTVRKAIGRTSRRSMAYKIHTKRRNDAPQSGEARAGARWGKRFAGGMMKKAREEGDRPLPSASALPTPKRFPQSAPARASRLRRRLAQDFEIELRPVCRYVHLDFIALRKISNQNLL